MAKCGRSIAVVIIAAMFVPFAAANAPVVESLLVGRADLSGVWRARAGDDPGWAEPTFDDSGWRRVPLPGGWAEEGFTGVDGPIWYRREVPIGKPLTGRAADGWGILIGRTRFGSVSVWVNGHSVGQVGGPRLTVPVPALRAMAIPREAVEGNDRLVVAIRVTRVAWASDRAQSGGPVGNDIVLAPLQELLVQADGDRDGDLVATLPMLMGALMLLLAALYFLYLWGRWRFGTEYLWFGLSSLSLAGNTLLNTPWIYELTDRFPLVYRLTEISGLLTPALFMEFLWTFLRRPMGRLLRAYQGSFGLIALAIMVTPRLGWVVDTQGLRWSWLLPLLIWGLITVVMDAWRGNEAARSVMLAGALLVAAELLAIVAHFAGWVPPLGLEPSMAFCVFVVAMGVILGDRLNRMRTELDALCEDLEARVASRTLALQRALDSEATLHAQVEKSENALRGIVEKNADGILVLDAAGEVLFANPAAGEMLAAGPGGLTGTRPNLPASAHPLDIIHTTDSSGRERVVEVRNAMTEWSEGPASLITLGDVTERQHLEERLVLLHAAVEAIPVGITLTGLDGTIIHTNPVQAAMHGKAVSDLIGAPARCLAPEHTWSSTSREALNLGQAWTRESVNIRADGRTFPVELRSVPIRGADGRVLAFATACVDITARRRAEEALRESEARFRGFVENAQIGIYRTTPDGRITMANPKLANVFGFASPEVLMRENLEEWAVRGRLDRERFKVLMDGDGAITGLESEITRPDGKVIAIREYVRAIRDEDGVIRFYEGTIEDLTEHKALEAQLRHSQKMEAVGRLAGGVAHDFNNLLQALLSHTQILHHQSEEPEAVRRVARELEQQVHRGAALTRQLLVFSRRETVKRERLDLNETVQDAMQILQRLVRENIALTLELAPGSLPVQADRGQLQQILMNLAVNASDAMPSGGTLVIRAGAGDNEEVVLTVEDTGHGIPEGIRERIFEPFFTTKTADRGTGLGLSVVHGIVTQHGGRIEVESTVGRGSTFRVFLPRAGPPNEAGAPSPPCRDAMPGAGERVLLVEDEEAAREGLQEILISLGYDVAAIASGEDAKCLPADRPFDVLLTDVMLPGVAGPQLAQTLKERWPGLKVILMSGYAEDETVRRGASEGEVRFLQKPFSMETLANELRAALGEPTGSPLAT